MRELSEETNAKLALRVYMQGEPDKKVLSLHQHQAKTLRTLKKKILNEFEYEQSQGRLIQVNIMEVYPSQPEEIPIPIINQPNLRLLIDFLTSHDRPIILHVTFPNGRDTLKKKEVISQQSIKMGVIHFDENGSLIEETDEMKELLPLDPKYDNTGYVRCEFCQKNSKNVDYLKKCGGLYGPFGDNKYVHLLCAVWCHRIFLDDHGLLQNVLQVIAKSIKTKCIVCKQSGAGLACVGSKLNRKNAKVKCKRRFHFGCAYGSGCMMNWMSYKMLCQGCKEDEENCDELLKQAQNVVVIDEEEEKNEQMVVQQQCQLARRFKNQLFL